MIRTLFLLLTTLFLLQCQKQEPLRTQQPKQAPVTQEPVMAPRPMAEEPPKDGQPDVPLEPKVDPPPDPPPADPIETMTIPEEPLPRARLYYEMGYGASALQVLGQLPESERETGEVQLLFGLAAALRGQNRHAVTACRKAAELLENNTEKTKALFCQGRAHLALREHANALRTLEEALKLSPENLPVRLAMMDIYLQLKNRDVLHRFIQETLQLHPGNGAVLLELGSWHELSNQREKAHETWEKLTMNDQIPSWIEAEAFDRMGMLWIRANPRRAREILERCEKRVPGVGCPRTELSLSPPVPRHPERKVRNVTRPGRYGTNP